MTSANSEPEDTVTEDEAVAEDAAGPEQQAPEPQEPAPKRRGLFARIARRLRSAAATGPVLALETGAEAAADGAVADPVEDAPLAPVEDPPAADSGNDSDRSWHLNNLVPQPVEIPAAGAAPPIRIPPFGRFTISQADLRHYPLREWVSRGVLEMSEAEDDEEFPPELVLVLIWGGGAFYSGFFWLIAAGIGKIVDRSPSENWWMWSAVLATIASIGYLTVHVIQKGALRSKLRKMRHSVGAVVQLAISFGIPAIAVFSAPFASPEVVSTTPQLVNLSVFDFQLLQFDVMRVAPALQVLMIGVLSGLPALLFYMFDRQKLSTLRDEFYRSIVVLVPSIHTVQDAESVFGLRAQAVLGNTRARAKSGRFLPHNRSMIFVTTIIVTVGWIVTLANEPGRTGWPLNQYFVPTKDALVYAFLGAYTFGMLMLFRRYARSDIKPAAYAHFTVRTITAIIIAWTATLMLPADDDSIAILVVAFVIGFFPDTGLTAIFEFVKNSKFIKSNIPSMAEKFALERLDGINIYHRARLIDEGIENMENLAHAELIELMLQTRIPLATLIDWIDQSILFLHAGSRDASDEKDMGVLRKHGIRTASDLEKARDAAARRDRVAMNAAAKNGKSYDGDELGSFLGLLESDKPVRRLETILDALEDDEWMENIRVWRNMRFPTNALKDPSQLDW